MESQPQSPELRNNPENFRPCTPTGVFIGGYCEYMGLDARKLVLGVRKHQRSSSACISAQTDQGPCYSLWEKTISKLATGNISIF